MSRSGSDDSQARDSDRTLAATIRGREKGHFPSQTVPNRRGQPAPQNTPTGQFEISFNSNRQVQAIHTLQSGKRVDNQVQDHQTILIL